MSSLKSGACINTFEQHHIRLFTLTNVYREVRNVTYENPAGGVNAGIFQAIVACRVDNRKHMSRMITLAPDIFAARRVRGYSPCYSPPFKTQHIPRNPITNDSN